MADKAVGPKHDQGLVPNVKRRGRALPGGSRLDEMAGTEALAATLANEAEDDWRENATKAYKTLLDSTLETS